MCPDPWTETPRPGRERPVPQRRGLLVRPHAVSQGPNIVVRGREASRSRPVTPLSWRSGPRSILLVHDDLDSRLICRARWLLVLPQRRVPQRVRITLHIECRLLTIVSSAEQFVSRAETLGRGFRATRAFWTRSQACRGSSWALRESRTNGSPRRSSPPSSDYADAADTATCLLMRMRKFCVSRTRSEVLSGIYRRALPSRGPREWMEGWVPDGPHCCLVLVLLRPPRRRIL